MIISAGTLGSLAQRGFCQRCFWLQLKLESLPFKMPLPGVFSSIDSYVKNVVRTWFDTNGVLPPWFPDIGRVVKYEARMHYTRFSVVDPESEVTLRGTPDEVFHLDNGHIHIIDYKTSRLSAAQDFMFPGYEVQLNAYAYICARIGLPPVVHMSLLYLEPDTDLAKAPHLLNRSVGSLLMGFTPKIRPVQAKPYPFIESLLATAKAIHDSPSPPAPAAGCKNCSAIEELVKVVT
ncbi:MAG: PD-(D/E)XK nuclease family protein [Chloroflexi bacterium]|nr:PD-(D/E)XK nuclease family protein [Chloroflexota bacterium]